MRIVLISWNVLGLWIRDTEGYTDLFLGKNSASYQNLERENGWYESKL